MGNIDGKVVRIYFQIGIFSAYITNCFRHAEEIDQVIPFMDQVDGHAAAQGLVGMPIKIDFLMHGLNILLKILILQN